MYLRLIFNLMVIVPFVAITSGTSQDLPVIIEGLSEFCDGASTVLSATPGYATYTWSTGDITETTVVDQSDIYSVLVSDGAGNTGIDYFQVTELETVPFFIQGPDEICPGTETELYLSESYDSYLWEDGSTASTRVISDCATYTVTVTDSNGCTQAESITVSCPANLEIILIENTSVSCIGDCDGVLQAGLLVNDGSSSLVWSTGSTSTRLENLCPGEYSLTITDNTGCSAADTFYVQEPDSLSLEVVEYHLPTCYDDADGEAIIQGTGGTAPYLYFWPDGSNNDTITTLNSGIHSVTIVDSRNCDAIVDVSIPDIIPLSINVDHVANVDCFGEDTGSIQVSGSGGHGDYQYAWSTGSQADNINGLTADTYAITLVDSLGCNDVRLIPITENTDITAVANVTHVSQTGDNDGEITLEVNGGTGLYAYAWNNGQNSSSIIALTAGTYTCTITDSADCEHIISTIVNDGDCLITLSTSTVNAKCFGGNDGEITVETTFGLPPVEISIFDSDGNQVLAETYPSGDYVIIVQDQAGCSIQSQVTIGQPIELTSEIILMDQPTCDNVSDGTALANVTGGTEPYTYLWSNDKTTEMSTDLPTGSQYVIITDANNCSTTNNIMVTPNDNIAPELSLKPYEMIIESDGTISMPAIDVFLDAVSDNCSGTTLAFAHELDIDCTDADYEVTIIATDENGNSTERTTLMSVRDMTPPTINCTGDMLIGECETFTYSASATDNCQESVEVSLVQGYASGEDIPVGTSEITLEAVDMNGNSTMCTFSVTVEATPQLETDKLDLLCYGEASGQIDVTNADDFATITINNTDATFENLEAGTYTITGTDLYGCIATTEVTIITPNQINSAYTDVMNETFEGEQDGTISLEVNGGVSPYSVIWFLDGIETTSVGTQISALAPGVYHSVIADANGCVMTSESVTIEPGEVVISSTSELEKLGVTLDVYPNPASDLISTKISNTDLTVEEVRIINLSGKTLYQHNQLTEQIRVSDFNPGIYFIQVITTEGNLSTRWVKY